jgi:hypothetical protein
MSIKAMKDTEMMAIGRLYKQRFNTIQTKAPNPVTYKDAQTKRPRLEIVLERESRRDGDRVGDVQRRHRDREDGVDSLRARERQHAENDRKGDHKPHGVDRRLGEAVHAVQVGGEWQRAITCKRE